MEKIHFRPEIKVTDRPYFNFKFFGREDKEWHRDIIERIDVTDMDNDNIVVQTLTGFSASSSRVYYADINYDGYLDILLSHADVNKEEYIYWLFNPLKRNFERNTELDKIHGFPSRFPWQKKIHFGSGQIYQVENGEFIKISSD